MPDDLVSLFRPVYMAGQEAFNKGDLDGAFGGLPEDFEWIPLPTDLDPGPHRGPEQIKRYMAQYVSTFDDWTATAGDYEQVGDAALLLRQTIVGTSRAAGVPVEVAVFELWEFDGVQPVRVRQFSAREEALAAINA